MRLKLLSFFIMVLCLLGCATEAKYQNIVDGWAGASEEALIDQWGIPDSSYELNDTKYLSYKRWNNYYIEGIPSSYTSTVVGNKIYTNKVAGTPNRAGTNWCTTTFTIKAGKIIKGHFKGNDCLAY